MGKIRSIIDLNEKNDGLIFYYSGHGQNRRIILSNGKSVLIENIIDIFDGEKCDQLRNKPKIMIYDSCRGNGIAETLIDKRYNDNTGMMNSKPPKTRGKTEWYDERHHKNSGFATIFSNFAGDSINDSSIGGCMTRAIEQVFENPKDIDNYSLQDLIIPIRKVTKINAGRGNKQFKCSAQLVDFHEAMEYKVYFKKNNSQ